MPEHLIRKLERYVALSSEDKQVLRGVASGVIKNLQPREDILRTGDVPQAVNLVLVGWLCQYRDLEDGRRQVSALLVAGDFCSGGMLVPARVDYGLAPISSATVAQIPRSRLEEICAHHPKIAEALKWNAVQELAIAREWMTCLGRRTAVERLAHLFCELYFRLQTVGLARDLAFEMPLTQDQLADVAGMTAVHVNRSLMRLREEGVISLEDRHLQIHDLDTLRAIAMFDPAYLHGAGESTL